VPKNYSREQKILEPKASSSSIFTDASSGLSKVMREKTLTQDLALLLVVLLSSYMDLAVVTHFAEPLTPTIVG
jgi:hypothetical protein